MPLPPNDVSQRLKQAHKPGQLKTQFRNGEAIPLAKTNAEWELAGQNQQPAWCYYEKTTTELVYQATDGVNKADSIVIAQAIIQLNSTVIA